jgi:hypothetical protein
LSVLKEYRKREEEFLKRAKDLEQITNLRDEQKQKYDSLRKQRLDEFMAGFSLISMKLKEMYQVRFNIFSYSKSLVWFWYADDYSGWQRRAGVSWQYGSILRGHYLQRHASEEKLEEHFESVRWREGKLCHSAPQTERRADFLL